MSVQSQRLIWQQPAEQQSFNLNIQTCNTVHVHTLVSAMHSSSAGLFIIPDDFSFALPDP